MQINSRLFISTTHISLFIISIALSWLLHASVNFGYSLWFDVLEIGPFIQKMAPLNHHKIGFDLLSKPDYTALFQSINIGIHLAPESLQALQYSFISQDNIMSTSLLLRSPEVIHLQDVATLISSIGYITLLALCVLVFLWLLAKKQNFTLQSNPLRQVGVTWVCLSAITAIIFVSKPVQFFYWLHEIIFPDNHQWFFYYQDSLMTTLMKAPVLFGPIAITLLIGCFFCHLGLTAAFCRSLQKTS